MIKNLIYDWKDLNNEIFYTIHKTVNFFPKLMKILVLFTELANYVNIIFLILITALINLLLVRRESLYTNRDNYIRYFVIPYFQNYFFILFGYFFTLLIISYIKRYFLYLRPICFGNIEMHYFEMAFNNVNDFFRKKCSNDGSFPSAHAATSILIALYFWHYTYKTYIKFLIILYVFLIDLSRIALGLHYPADIVGGTIIGIICYFSWEYVYNKINNKYYNQVRNILEKIF